MKRLLFSAMLVMAFVAASAQSTQKFTAAKHNEYGLTYSLPTTHLRVTVEAEKTVKKAGPFYLAVSQRRQMATIR